MSLMGNNELEMFQAAMVEARRMSENGEEVDEKHILRMSLEFAFQKGVEAGTQVSCVALFKKLVSHYGNELGTDIAKLIDIGSPEDLEKHTAEIRKKVQDIKKTDP